MKKKAIFVSDMVQEKIRSLKDEERYDEIVVLLKNFSKAQDEREKLITFNSAMNGLKEDLRFFEFFTSLREIILREKMTPFLKEEKQNNSLYPFMIYFN